MIPKTVLYQAKASPPSRAVRMIIDILGIDVELRDLNPVLREQVTPEFIQVRCLREVF